MKAQEQSSKVSTVHIHFSQAPASQIHNLNPYLFKPINAPKTIIQKIQQNKMAKTYNYTQCKDIVLRQTVDFSHYKQPSPNKPSLSRKVKYDNLRTCLTDTLESQQRKSSIKLIENKERYSFKPKHYSDKILKYRHSMSKSQINPYTQNQYKYIRNKQIDSALFIRNGNNSKKNKSSITQSFKITQAALTPKRNTIQVHSNIIIKPKHRSELNFQLSPWSYTQD